MAFNEEFLQAVAHGDSEAMVEVNKLPLTARIQIGLAVDKIRDEQNIIPMSTGFTVYEKQKSPVIDDDAIGKALQETLKRKREKEEREEKSREEHLRKVIEYKVQRARAGLPY